MLQNFDLNRILLTLPAVVIALVFHEFCHAFVARLEGDTSAKEMGRLTLNPLKHIDPLGFIFLLIAGFGWAKPVMFDPARMKHKTVGPVLVALAGPFSNLLLAFVCLPFIAWSMGAYQAALMSGTNADVLYVILQFLSVLFYINLGLFIFNLLPIPPLDGSHVLFAAIPNLSDTVRMRITQIGSLLLFGALIISALTKVNLIPILPMVKTLGAWMLGLIGN